MSERFAIDRTVRDELYETIQSDAAFDRKAREALELGRQYLGVDNGHLTRIDREANRWETIVSTDPPDGNIPVGLDLDLRQTYCRRVVEANSTIALSDAPNQGWGNDPAFEAFGVHCYHGTSLVVDGEIYGTACFIAEEPRDEFSEEDTVFAELVAKLLERELENEQNRAALTRQSNLAIVLNRVLRHNLRNDLSIARGFTERMAERLDYDTDSEAALRSIDRLIALSEKANRLDRIVGSDTKREPTDVASVISQIVGRMSRAHQDASFQIHCDDDIVTSLSPSFEQVLKELVENAAKHGGSDPTVTVSASATAQTIEITIADTGPGLDDQEAEVLRTGIETPLRHGSGLGLWLAHWIVVTHNGTIDTAVTEEGTTMTITIPRQPVNGRERLLHLTRQHDLFEAIFIEANDAIVVVDDDARILHANHEASVMYGVSREKLLGQTLPQFLPEWFDFTTVFAEFRKEGSDQDIVPILGEDGVERNVEYSATADIIPGNHLFIGRQRSDGIKLDGATESEGDR